MKLVFAGTPEFAAVALRALHEAGFEIPLVLTQPDRPAGRGMQLQASAVKQYALAHGMEVLQPLSLRMDSKDPQRAVEARAAHERLQALDWPGNIRELRNTVERLLILAAGPRIVLGDVERLVGPRAGDATGGFDSLEQFTTYEEFKLAAERAFLLVKLRQFDWNVAETARVLDMPRSNLYKKIERHGLAREQG